MRIALWILLLVSLGNVVSCNKSSEQGAACQTSMRTVASGESAGKGGAALSFKCSDQVIREVECLSTVDGNPASAPMTCSCKASGAATKSFDLPAAERGKLTVAPATPAFINAQCGWMMPTGAVK
ncbi:MAG: hypothetical protein IPI67_24950 [Myxococcales bacterium]|nr:hypothetical protein [Myxococcales bacterium]